MKAPVRLRMSKIPRKGGKGSWGVPEGLSWFAAGQVHASSHNIPHLSICQRSQDRKDPSRGKSVDKATISKPPLPCYAFESTIDPTVEEIERLRKAYWSNIVRYERPCNVCPKAKSKISKSKKDRRLRKGKEAKKPLKSVWIQIFPVFDICKIWSLLGPPRSLSPGIWTQAFQRSWRRASSKAVLYRLKDLHRLLEFDQLL